MIKENSVMLVAVHTHTQAYLQKIQERRKLYLSFSPITSWKGGYILEVVV